MKLTETITYKVTYPEIQVMSMHFMYLCLKCEGVNPYDCLECNDDGFTCKVLNPKELNKVFDYNQLNKIKVSIKKLYKDVMDKP